MRSLPFTFILPIPYFLNTFRDILYQISILALTSLPNRSLVPGNGILGLCEFLVEHLVFIVFHQVVDGVEVWFYCPFSLLWYLYEFLFDNLGNQRVTTIIYPGKS